MLEPRVWGYRTRTITNEGPRGRTTRVTLENKGVFQFFLYITINALLLRNCFGDKWWKHKLFNNLNWLWRGINDECPLDCVFKTVVSSHWVSLCSYITLLVERANRVISSYLESSDIWECDRGGDRTLKSVLNFFQAQIFFYRFEIVLVLGI